jgi:hypothetical protein
VLAFYLAFTHSGPLSPVVFLTVALCMLAGNALPIAAYLIFTRWREAELRAEAAEADLRVRAALRRSEEVIARLDEAEGALAKSVLLARQIPDRIEERFKVMEELAARLDPVEVSALVESIQAALPAPREPVEEDDGGPVGERLDLLYESLEGIQDSLDGMLARLAEMQAAAKPAARPVKAATKAAAPARPAQEELSMEGAAAVSADESPRDPEAGEPDPDPPSAPAGDAPDRGRTGLVAHAMVGMSNRLFIRGDEPWLSWDRGQPMELIGIGEFAWSSDDLKEPIEATVYLNDAIEANEGVVELKPGKTVRLNFSFPKA